MGQGPTSSRRDFLAGRSAVAALGQLAPETQAASSAELPAPDAGGYLIQVSRTAMACQFEVLLNAGQYPAGADAALRALDLVDQLEQQLSVFRESSEVSQLNRRAFAEPMVVERQLFDLFARSVALWKATAQAFDITSGPLTRAWGFYRRAGRVPPADELDAARTSVGSQWMQLDDATGTVRFLRPNMEINLGAIGKGYALDRCAASLEADEVGDFLLHGGTSSVVARGSRSGRSTDKPGWSVALRHPLRPEQRLAEFRLHNRALGTSGSGNQFFFHEGRRLSHVIDPRSGQPAEQVLSATVLAPSAAEADALSTAFFVGGPEVAEQYCRAHPEVAAILVPLGSAAVDSQLLTFNLTEHDRW